MRRIVYVSSAPALLSQREIHELLEKSRANNAVAGITGLLVYESGNFMQVLEGPRDALDALMKRIKADPRHRNVIELVDHTVAKRYFPNWSMAYPRPRQFEGPTDSYLNRFLDGEALPAPTEINARRVKIMLESFRGMLRGS